MYPRGLLHYPARSESWSCWAGKAQTAANANLGPQAPASLDFGFACDAAAREHEVKAGCEKFYNVLYEKKR